jgi:hypothetical protein
MNQSTDILSGVRVTDTCTPVNALCMYMYTLNYDTFATENYDTKLIYYFPKIALTFIRLEHLQFFKTNLWNIEILCVPYNLKWRYLAIYERNTAATI